MINATKKQGLPNTDYREVISDNIIKRPLFHGTRKWVTEASEERLNDIREKALLLIRFIQTKYFESSIDKKQIEDCMYDINLYTKYHCKNTSSLLSVNSCSEYKHGCKSYEYGDIYVTNKIDKAISFSCYIGGELLDFAYCALTIIKHLKYIYNDEIDEAINTVTDLYDKYCNDERIVLIINDANSSDLLDRGGAPFDEEEYDLRQWEKWSLDFRIKNIDKYKVEYITEDMFVEYLRAFDQDLDLINGYPANFFNLELRNDCLKKAEEECKESYYAQKIFVKLCLEVDKDENKAIKYAKKWAEQGNISVKNYMTGKGYII